MVETVVRWSMTASFAEVLRMLPPELSASGTVSGWVIEGTRGEGHWRLELAAAPPLLAGALALEVTELAIRLRGFTASERDAFLARLQDCCRRGGG